MGHSDIRASRVNTVQASLSGTCFHQRRDAMGREDNGSPRHLFKKIHAVRTIQRNDPENGELFNSVTVVNDLTEDMNWTRYMGVFDRLLNHLEGIYHPITITSGTNLDYFHRYIPLLSRLPRVCAYDKYTLGILSCYYHDLRGK